MKTLRQHIAYIFFALSSLCKGLGKMIITKEKQIVVDALTLPGWFIIDECIIHSVLLNDGKLIGFTWHYWPMPDQWCNQMTDMKRTH